ncbi:hypothetical protein [Paractinoplanes toevensis]|uniref:Uncharacterized protein n=1 Tax=Paractinoplanes toevensis TaxID=571911 RepID=A0A919W374_9ACTN|nr:hypothetical protein [Actinoplanes toevensis]GIM88818.1 hypothetical protein Ato02nite_006110 [Actinoplanes toevensis]
MQDYAIEISLADGGRHVGFGQTGTASYAFALQIRDNWQSWKVQRPNDFITLDTGHGTTNITAGDITEVQVRVGV